MTIIASRSAIFKHRDSEGEKKHLRSLKWELETGVIKQVDYAGRVTHSNRVVFSPGPRLRVNPPLLIVKADGTYSYRSASGG
jgi:hypothetical protein